MEHNLGVTCDPIESFTAERLRLVKLLAIPAAAAIHNARHYEWAQIYAAERQTLLKKADASATPGRPDRSLPTDRH
jgi:GAF domain-containing protein